MSTVGYSSPLRFKRNLRPGVIHPFDGAPIEVVGQLDTVVLDPLVYSFDHFVNYSGPLADGSAGGYTLTCTVGTATLVHTAEDYGKITILSSTTADDNFVFGNDSMIVNYATDKNILWSCKLSLSDADDMEFFAGLAIPTVDWVAALPTDGFFFSKAETATDLSFQIRASGTSTTIGPLGLTLTDAGDVILVIRIENGHITPYVHQSTTGWIVGTTTVAGSANIPAITDDLESQIAAETGGTAANGVILDWMYMSKEG